MSIFFEMLVKVISKQSIAMAGNSLIRLSTLKYHLGASQNGKPAKGETFIFSRYTKNEQAGGTFAANQIFLSYDFPFGRGGNSETDWLHRFVAENRRDPWTY